jgi:citrate lyase subunit beta/citryl-CoA lyase
METPLRSVLYVPGSNERALDKVGSLSADGYILDLEDAVAPDRKEPAREAVVRRVRAGGFGPSLVAIRTNGLGTSWAEADLAAAACSGAHAVVLPKVESAGEVRRAEQALVDAGAPAELALWCMIETPRGVLSADAIAGATDRVTVLVMGTSDLVKDLRCAQTRDRAPLLTSLSLCVLAARANGRAILDGVHLDLSDDEGFLAACRQGRELGFDGKTLIHPRTIAKTNEIFSPSPGELAHARRIAAAHAEALARGAGVVVVDGRLVEGLHVEEAERLLLLDAAIAGRGGAS